jgi:DNA-binding response OmpR family regulator
MKSKAEKLLVVESDVAVRQHIVAVLSDAGYEVSTDDGEGMKAILAFDPDATFCPKSRVPSTAGTYAS